VGPVVDKSQLLEFLIDREERNPGGSLQGSTLLMEAAFLEPDRSLAYNNITRAVAELKRLGWIEWVYRSWPNGPTEPPPHLISDQDLQNVGEIIVSNAGHERLAERRSQAARTQINIVNSVVGQLALGDLHKVDLFLILAAAEKKLDELDVPAEEKEEARGVLRRMRDVGSTMLTDAVAAVLSDAVRKALGLP
jgi:hypothetical protein